MANNCCAVRTINRGPARHASTVSVGQKLGLVDTHAFASGHKLDGIVRRGMLIDGAARISLSARPGFTAANIAQINPPVECPIRLTRSLFGYSESTASSSQSAALATAK